MKFCTITPSRGDRPQFLEFCKHQLSRMTIKPDHSYFIDYPPKSGDVDLVERIQKGIRQAQADGFEDCHIIEDDDFYPADYFTKNNLERLDFIGEEKTTYYNLRNKTWQTMHHAGRSSLFLTGFKISALKEFNWPKRTERFLDLSLWSYAKGKKRSYVSTGAIGIKHNVGLCGGKGHVLRMKNEDLQMEWLKANVSTDAYLFYKSLNL